MTARPIHAIALAGLVLAVVPTASRAESGPVAAVRAIYAPYLAPAKGLGPDQLAPKLYSARRRAEIGRLHKACRGKDGCLPDADHFVGGQAYRITGLTITEVSADATTARVEADFANFDTHEHMVFTMVREGRRWVVDDLEGGRPDARHTLDDALRPGP